MTRRWVYALLFMFTATLLLATALLQLVLRGALSTPGYLLASVAGAVVIAFATVTIACAWRRE